MKAKKKKSAKELKAEKSVRKMFKTSAPKKKKKHDPTKNLPADQPGQLARDEKWELFCLEFVKHQNAAEAARAVGYSEATARQIGYELLTRPYIKLRITQLLNERKARVKMEGDEILIEAGKLARSDIRDLFDEKGLLRPMHEWPDHIAVAVASVETIEKHHPFTGELIGVVRKVKLWDKVKPQELVGKNQKLWTDVVESSGNLTVTAVSAEDVKKKVREIEEDV